MSHEHQEHDYRSSMQRAAFAYLQRHAAEHLADSDLLFERCVRHLVCALEVPAFLAPQLVHNAWSELPADPLPSWVGVDWASGESYSVVHLIDRRTDVRYPITARFLPQKMLDQRDITPATPAQ